MTLAIIGGRDYNDYPRLQQVIETYFTKETNGFKQFTFDTIVSGAASGADRLGATFAKEHNIKLIEYPADWQRWGRSAGFIRNEDIIKAADCVLCMWDGQSKGSANSLSIAKRLKKDTIVIYY